ncbi:MAG: hypothetical protein U9O87_04535 [Verrucomicrobiota bacterium]|nr:hypothetical protein [Verrucomicrobiota bacterium]
MISRLYLLMTIVLFSALIIVFSQSISAEEQSVFFIKRIYSGFRNPEGSVYDPVRDCYYISNMNGGPSQKDNSAFISRIKQKKKNFNVDIFLESSEKIELHAPKGMAVKKDFLFIADIDSVVLINIEKRKFISRIKINGARFLNDIVIDAENNMFVSDTATDMIFKLAYPYTNVKQNALSVSKYLKAPNGLMIHPETDNLWIVSFKSPFLVELNPKNGKLISRKNIKTSGHDGICRGFDSDDIFVSIHSKGYLLKISPSSSSDFLVKLVNKKKLEKPADISYDPIRNIIVVPEMSEGSVSLFRVTE